MQLENTGEATANQNETVWILAGELAYGYFSSSTLLHQDIASTYAVEV
jgi:hypothetical protein